MTINCLDGLVIVDRDVVWLYPHKSSVLLVSRING